LQGKALAGLATAALVASMVGCGSGDSGSPTSTSTQPAGGSTESTPASGEAAAVERQFQEGIERAQRRRRRHAAEGEPNGEAEPAPPVAHRDSGGGAAQFRGPGDNSIQESGREASPSERERAAAALHGYLDSHAAGRWTAACRYMSATLVVGLERMGALSQSKHKPKGCPKTLAALSAGLPPRVLREGAQANVGSLRVNGERAFILYHGARGSDYAMPMVKEGGEWRVAALAGAPLTR
jgi:hypothetical protein